MIYIIYIKFIIYLYIYDINCEFANMYIKINYKQANDYYFN